MNICFNIKYYVFEKLKALNLNYLPNVPYLLIPIAFFTIITISYQQIFMRSTGKAFFIIFSLIWVLILLGLYINRHQIHVLALTQFKQFHFFLFIQLFGIVLFTVIQFINSIKIKKVAYTGIFCIMVMSLFMFSILSNFNNFINESLQIGELGSFLSRLISFGFIILTICTAMFGSGSLIAKLLKIENPTVSLQLLFGCCALMTIMFVLASFHILNQLCLVTALVVLIGANYKKSGLFVKDVLITPLRNYQAINYWGFITLYFLVIAMSINILAVISPYPYGFDSRNFYMNVTQLISENNGLVEGFQPYNWQLLMSSGFVLTNSHEIAILLSVLGFVFCIVAINEFMAKILDMDINYRLLAITLYTVTPAVYNQLSIDVKIDFGLLFFQIVIVHFFLKSIKDKNISVKWIMILGVFCGFAMGIKFTHLYLIAAMLIAYGASKGGYLGLVGISLAAVAVFLIAKVDDIGGLRTAHLGVEYVQWGCLLLGILFLLALGFTAREKLFKICKFVTVLAVFTTLPLMPWVLKNYSESKSLSPKSLLMGEAPGVKVSANQLIREYKKLKN